MKRLTLLVTAACLLAPAAAFAQKPETLCPKPFTAKAVGGGSDEVRDVACQGPVPAGWRKLTEDQYFAKVMAEAQQEEARKGGRRK